MWRPVLDKSGKLVEHHHGGSIKVDFSYSTKGYSDITTKYINVPGVKVWKVMALRAGYYSLAHARQLDVNFTCGPMSGPMATLPYMATYA